MSGYICRHIYVCIFNNIIRKIARRVHGEEGEGRMNKKFIIQNLNSLKIILVINVL